MVYHTLGMARWLSSSIQAGSMMVPNQEVEAKCKYNIPIRSALHHVLTGSDRFSSSNPHGDFAFIVGADTVIEGMEQAVKAMTLGEKSIFTIPP